MFDAVTPHANAQRCSRGRGTRAREQLCCLLGRRPYEFERLLPAALVVTAAAPSAGASRLLRPSCQRRWRDKQLTSTGGDGRLDASSSTWDAPILRSNVLDCESEKQNFGPPERRPGRKPPVPGQQGEIGHPFQVPELQVILPLHGRTLCVRSFRSPPVGYLQALEQDGGGQPCAAYSSKREPPAVLHETFGWAVGSISPGQRVHNHRRDESRRGGPSCGYIGGWPCHRAQGPAF